MEAHLVKLLASNDPPSENVMQELNEVMATPLQELAEANQRIEDLEAQLLSLKEQRAKIESSLQGYRTIMSPIRRLPDDVFHEIFYHCLPSHRNSIPSAAEAPLLLMRVSSRWRSIALSSPRLWAQLYISFCDNYRFSIPRFTPWHIQVIPPRDNVEDAEKRRQAFEVLSQRVEIVQDWLKRSGTYPLSVSLSYRSVLWDPSDIEANRPADDPTTKLFETILSHSHHLKSLEVVMPTEIYRQLDNLVSPNLFSTLTDLKISLHNESPYTGDDTDTADFPHRLFKAPHLQRLSLEGYPFNNFWLQRTLPFDQQGKNLKYISSHILHSRQEAFDLLKACENLVHCRLHIGLFNNEAVPAIHGIASLPRLRTFAIIDHDTTNTDEAIQFYSSIDAPQLRWIDYQTRHHGDDDNTAPHTHPLLYFLRKSMQLKKLTIDPFNLTHDVLREALQIVSPTLTHLVVGQEVMLRTPRVTQSAWAPSLMSSMSLNFGILVVDKNSNFDSEILLPNLDTLEVSTGSISDDVLLQILTSRIDASSRSKCEALKLVRVIFDRPKKLDIHEEVKQHLEFNKEKTGDRIRNMKLYLEYGTQAALVTDPLSVSYGLQNDRLWPLIDLDETLGNL